MDKTPLAKISLYQSFTLRLWSFDLSDAPKDFQKCFNTSFCLAITALRLQVRLEEAFLPNAYLQFNFYEKNCQIVLDISQNPIFQTEDPLTGWLNEVKAPCYPVVMTLGPKWYLLTLQTTADENGYDYDLIVRSQYPDEVIVPYEERDYLILTSDGECV